MTFTFILNILWHCLSLGPELKQTFPSPVATAEFSKFAGTLSAALSQHHLSGFEIAQLEFHLMLYGDLNGKEIPKRGDICTCIVESLCCTVETNTTL